MHAYSSFVVLVDVLFFAKLLKIIFSDEEVHESRAKQLRDIFPFSRILRLLVCLVCASVCLHVRLFATLYLPHYINAARGMQQALADELRMELAADRAGLCAAGGCHRVSSWGCESKRTRVTERNAMCLEIHACVEEKVAPIADALATKH